MHPSAFWVPVSSVTFPPSQGRVRGRRVEAGRPGACSPGQHSSPPPQPHWLVLRVSGMALSHVATPLGGSWRGSISGVNKGVQVTALLPANETMSGELSSTSLSPFVNEMGS